MRIQERAVVLGFKTAWAVTGYLPQQFLDLVAGSIAIRTFKKNDKGIQRLRFNLARVINADPGSKEVADLTLKAIRSYMNYWVSMFALPKRNDDFVLSHVSVQNSEYLETALSSGLGALVAVTHSGNWDLAGAYIAKKYGGITTVAERLRPVELFDEFTKHRSKRNITILPHRGGVEHPSKVLVSEIRKGKLTGLVADRDLSSNGIEVQFFASTAKFPQGPAKIALETLSPLLPAAIWSEGHQTIIKFFPPISLESGDVKIVTQALASVFEEILREHPENWHMLQKIWLDMPSELAD